MKVKVKKIFEWAKLPDKATETDAGFDLYTSENFKVGNGKEKTWRGAVPLGLAIQLPDPCSKWWWKLGAKIFGWKKYRYQALIEPKSGMSLNGMVGVANIGDVRERFDCDVVLGKIDAGYRNEIKVLIENRDNEFIIPAKTKIAQMTITKVYDVDWMLVRELDNNDRGGGFGHSGV